ncbi:Reverse transcriptase family member [Operophtera brumata]|uniref:Reverse transcriptase family member n=1 Tax=Operophtera brumata TaxID=104452 RepID=A0A0L7LVP3_OPEBR|nr:Reverse transcriptase family member [Operophtera brumata]
MVKLALCLPMTKRGRGRPLSIWLTKVEKDLIETQLDTNTAKIVRNGAKGQRNPTLSKCDTYSVEGYNSPSQI